MNGFGRIDLPQPNESYPQETAKESAFVSAGVKRISSDRSIWSEYSAAPNFRRHLHKLRPPCQVSNHEGERWGGESVPIFLETCIHRVGYFTDETAVASRRLSDFDNMPIIPRLPFDRIHLSPPSASESPPLKKRWFLPMSLFFNEDNKSF